MSDENNMYENNQQPVQEQPVQEQPVQEPADGNDAYSQSVYDESAQNYEVNQSKGFGIASMVCGIIALITCCLWCTCIPLAVVSIVLGILQIKKGNAKGMAIAGIVCSAVGLVLFILLIIYGNYLESSGMLDSYYDMLKSYGYY